jgi:heme-degrading monooxygenase HmoA
MTATITPIRAGSVTPPAIEYEIITVQREPSSFSGPVAVHAAYTVSPGAADTWIELWKSVAAMASGYPGCRSFRLLRDRHDDMYCATFSEWDSIDAYTFFMHDSRSSWVSRALAQSCMPGEHRVLEAISVIAEAGEPVTFTLETAPIN